MHAGFSGLRMFEAREKGQCKLIGNRLVIPHDTIPSTVSHNHEMKNEENNTNLNFRQSDDTVLIVDPGFVHHRKIEAILGKQGTEIINSEIARIPHQTPEWRKNVLIDHIYSRIILDFCKLIGIRTIEENVVNKNGHLMCSIEQFMPTTNIFDSERSISKLKLKIDCKYEVELHYSTNKISSDTLKSGLTNGGEFAVVAEFHQMTDDKIILHPVLIGYPYLQSKKNGELLWAKYTDFYQLRIDDIKEFSKTSSVEMPKDSKPMKSIKESVFKECLHKILGDNIDKDWGGETSDYHSTHVHLGEKEYSCAFLLKGPADFRPMSLNHLGKNNDQIVRLSKEPVDILIVQHSHDITLAVRETLKVFATQPSNPKRYCFIDGRDSLRLLIAYDLLEWAKEKSKNGSG